jgi:hypothetical protein
VTVNVKSEPNAHRAHQKLQMVKFWLSLWTILTYPQLSLVHGAARGIEPDRQSSTGPKLVRYSNGAEGPRRPKVLEAWEPVHRIGQVSHEMAYYFDQVFIDVRDVR